MLAMGPALLAVAESSGARDVATSLRPGSELGRGAPARQALVDPLDRADRDADVELGVLTPPPAGADRGGELPVGEEAARSRRRGRRDRAARRAGPRPRARSGRECRRPGSRRSAARPPCTRGSRAGSPRNPSSRPRRRWRRGGRGRRCAARAASRCPPRSSSAIRCSSPARSGPSPTIRTRSAGRSPDSFAAASSSTSRAFCGRSAQTVPTTGTSAPIPSSPLMSAPLGAGGAGIPFGTKITLPGSIPSISIIRRRSCSETARKASARAAISRRSRSLRTGCP